MMMQHLGTALCFLHLWGIVSAQDSLTMLVEPATERAYTGSDFSVTCSTTAPISNSSVMWHRIQGDLRYQLAVDEMLNKDFITGETLRYELSGGMSDTVRRIYTLKVTHARPEDTAQIECSLVPGTGKALAKIAVCNDVVSNECDCMHNSGWASPKCFMGVEDNWEDQATEAPVLRRATIGLGVTTGLLIIYSLIMGVLMCRDNTEEIELKRREREEFNARRAKQGRFSETELKDADSVTSTSATATSSSNSSSASNGKKQREQPACVIVRTNSPPSNHLHSRRSEKAQSSPRSSNSTGYPNEGFIPDSEGQINHRTSGVALLDGDNQSDKIVQRKKSRKDQKNISNLDQSTGELSHKGQSSNDLSGEGEAHRRNPGQSTNNLWNKGQSSTDLSTSDNRTASYTSNSTASAAMPGYSKAGVSLQDTMI